MQLCFPRLSLLMPCVLLHLASSFVAAHTFLPLVLVMVVIEVSLLLLAAIAAATAVFGAKVTDVGRPSSVFLSWVLPAAAAAAVFLTSSACERLP